ncbi:MAG TPA: nitrile hydratase accessory protein [Bauldia sp.]|nr:nitrile hydratase accessory protein [Bauldia sp.]
MSGPETALLPREPAAGAPVFAEPWHAEVLAVAHALTRAGLFSSAQWAEALGAAIRRGNESGEPDSEEAYYRAALAALERLVGERSPEVGGMLAARVEAWRRAYLNTPHGRPVTLDAAAVPVENRHRHHDH